MKKLFTFLFLLGIINSQAQTAATGLHFDGIDDKIAIAAPVNLPLGNSTFTIEAWIKPVDNTTMHAITGWGTWGVFNAVNAFRTRTTAEGVGLVNYWWGNDLYATAGFDLYDGAWHHVAVTYDGVNRKIYVDGTVRAQDVPSASTHSVTAVNFAVGSTNNGEYFKGDMDEVHIWNRALCQSELQNNMVGELTAAGQTGLALLYHFNQGITNTNNAGITQATDASGNNNTGTLTNFSLSGSNSNWATGAVTGNSPAFAPALLAGTAGGAVVCQSANVQAPGINYLDGTCNLIANINSSGASPVTGIVNTCVTIDASVQSYNGHPYLQRHYDITPAANAATATGTITLYYNQAEFDAYNAVRGSNPALPVSAADATGIANILITQFHGTGTAPGNYSGAAVLINPADNKVIWNSTLNRWEITIDVNGFSGFFVHTNTTNTVLPVGLVSFAGSNHSDMNLLQWNTSTEQNTRIFELQRSIDGISFEKRGSVPAAANSSNNRYYSFNDNIAGLSQDAFYYRLKMIDIDGSFSFSNVVKISLAGKGFNATVTPNPFLEALKINIEMPSAEKADIILKDLSGKSIWQTAVLLQKGLNALQADNITKLPAGVYVLTIKTSKQQQTIKVMKQ
jgi:hypothetical protein